MKLLLYSLLLTTVSGGFNSMARTPPMSFRSWNQFGCNISQPDIENAIRGLADTSRLVNGIPTSLLQLGYNTAGLDDCFQELLSSSCHYPGFGSETGNKCSNPNTSFPVIQDTQCEGLAGPVAGINTATDCAISCCNDETCSVWQFCELGECTGSNAPPKSCYTGSLGDCGTEVGWSGGSISQKNTYTFHDNNGRTVVNKTRFPDLIAMTTLGHSLNISVGTYGNNCFCHDHCDSIDCFVGDVDETINMGFDAVKYDGCGLQKNMSLWAALYNGTSKADIMIIENCNNDNSLIPKKGTDLTKVPFHFYRTSTDIRPTYGSFVNNAQTILKLTTESGPSCW
jgi:hypothetical protein